MFRTKQILDFHNVDCVAIIKVLFVVIFSTNTLGRQIRPTLYWLLVKWPNDLFHIYEQNMTRTIKSRQQSRVESGYCAACHTSVLYDKLEEHIQSKRHTKLVSEESTQFALNDFFVGHSILDYNFDKNMPQTRSASSVRQRKEPSLSPSNETNHYLRPRKAPTAVLPPQPEPLNNCSIIKPSENTLGAPEKLRIIKEYRELRSTTRFLAKLTEQLVEKDDVWDSGRPKRTCSRQRTTTTTSTQEILLPATYNSLKDNFYNVKLGNTDNSNPHSLDTDTLRCHTMTRSCSNIQNAKRLKFPKVRHSELSQLNSEAESFLFPKKEVDTDVVDLRSVGNDVSHNFTPLLCNGDNCVDVKMEDAEQSNHSSDGSVVIDNNHSKMKKRRRTQAEAFITDNIKYYKFEMAGSRIRILVAGIIIYLLMALLVYCYSCYRLRYHGSYLPSVVPSIPDEDKKSPPLRNGPECGHINSHQISPARTPEKKTAIDTDLKITLDDYQFSFESAPTQQPWYQTFLRRDTGAEKYPFHSDYNYWDPLILPYQVDNIRPLNPRRCISNYNRVNTLLNDAAETATQCSTPDKTTSSNSSYPSSILSAIQDDDSKLTQNSSSSCNSSSTAGEVRKLANRIVKKTGLVSNSRNPRKSPRQHASTLAILGSLLHRKRKSPSTSPGKKSPPTKKLSTIREAVTEPKTSPEKLTSNMETGQKPPDYVEIAKRIQDELDRCLSNNPLLCDLSRNEHKPCGIDFRRTTQIGVVEILDSYNRKQLELHRLAELANKKKGRPKCGGGRRPGKRKKNRTGWPNTVNRRVRSNTNNNISSNNNNNNIEEINKVSKPLPPKNSKLIKTDSVKRQRHGNSTKNNMMKSRECSQAFIKNHSSNTKNRVIANSNSNSVNNTVKKQTINCATRRNNSHWVRVPLTKVSNVVKTKTKPIKRQSSSGNKRKNNSRSLSLRKRRIPPSPKSPRILRKPRGCWYREG